jgi:acetyl coenzyme A synthetase (ADP forming)-like protein
MNLEAFFKPKSVAVIGASREPRKFGHVIFKNFVESEFQGKTYPINPKADSILGLKAYAHLKDVPSQVDLAVISIPAPLVPRAVEECVSKNVKAAIIVSGGFKEIGEKGEQLELEISKRTKDSGLRIIGPNCIGVYDPVNHVDTLFLPRYRLRRPKRGPIAFISQSGAFGSAVLDWAASQEIGVSKFVSIGNKIDVDEVDLLEYLMDDPITKCITVYVESVSRGREFLNVASKVAKDKPLVVLKGGVTSEGASAALSHTGSLAGTARVVAGAFEQASVIQAHTVDELFDYGRALAYLPVPKDREDVAIVTNGGGFGVISTDEATKLGLRLAKFSSETVNRLKERLPDYANVRNPLDLVGDADVERYRIALQGVSSDPNVGIILAIVLLQTSYMESDVVDAITESQVTTGKPMVVCTIGGDFTQILVKMLEENQIPSYTTPERAISAIYALTRYAKALEDRQKKEQLKSIPSVTLERNVFGQKNSRNLR